MQKKILKFIRGIIINRKISQERKHEENLVVDAYKGKRNDLTKEEKRMLLHTWGWIGSVSCREYEIFKGLVGFDPRFLSHEIYLPLVAKRLNPVKYSKLWENKAFLEKFYSIPEVRIPVCYLKNIFGSFYNGDFEEINEDEAISSLLKLNHFIIKPSIDTSGGAGVLKCDWVNLSLDEKRHQIKSLFASYHSDYIVQEPIEQHFDTARFNKMSVNTLRITSLYLNGRTSVLSSVLRIGKQGAAVDNFGAGGIMVNVEIDGKLAENGYDIYGNSYKSIGGIKLSQCYITGYKKAYDFVMKNHSKTAPLCRLIGWDIGLDENNVPTLLEVNASQPGIVYEQWCSGPIWGERTAEVIDFLKIAKLSFK